MAEEQTPRRLSAADYAMIEAAVMETSRGRWFLSEYARRNRHADTETLLAALARLESGVMAAARAAGQGGRQELASEPEFEKIIGELRTVQGRLLAAAGVGDDHGINDTSQTLTRRVESFARDARDAAAALASTAQEIEGIRQAILAGGAESKLATDLSNPATALGLIVELERLTARRLADFGAGLVAAEAGLRELISNHAPAGAQSAAPTEDDRMSASPPTPAPPVTAAPTPVAPPPVRPGQTAPPTPVRPLPPPFEWRGSADRAAARSDEPTAGPKAAPVRPSGGTPSPATRRPSFEELARMSPIDRLKALS